MESNFNSQSSYVLPKCIRIFIDTEFTDFVNCDLISIGAAADNGAEFYGQNSDYIKAWASDWVKTNVLPLCQEDKWMTRNELSARLWSWIEELPCDFVIIMFDYQTDYDLLLDLFGEKHPKMISVHNLYSLMYVACDEQVRAMGGNDTDYQNLVRKVKANFELGFMDYFFNTKETQHHALSDAKANRKAWQFIVNKFGMPA